MGLVLYSQQPEWVLLELVVCLSLAAWVAGFANRYLRPSYWEHFREPREQRNGVGHDAGLAYIRASRLVDRDGAMLVAAIRLYTGLLLHAPLIVYAFRWSADPMLKAMFFVGFLPTVAYGIGVKLIWRLSLRAMDMWNDRFELYRLGRNRLARVSHVQAFGEAVLIVVGVTALGYAVLWYVDNAWLMLAVYAVAGGIGMALVARLRGFGRL